ncbi:MAG: hypothetical protein QME45_07870 [Clostridiales bacterium]|nr:hypothetical protein [Clostridiales bacterium]HBM80284.1 hypothetical protein [Clostridiaceae bacterium]
MSLIFSGIAPHGSSIIEEISGNEKDMFKPTRSAMVELGKRLKKNNIETIVIITPHGLKLKGYNAVYISENCGGSLTEFGNTISMELKCDVEIANGILKEARQSKIPCIGANYGTSSGPESKMPMDWGIMIPLWFLGGNDESKPQIVVITPSRDIPLDDLVSLGKIIATVCQKSDKKIALIASADQAHAHSKDGIYGFNPAAKEYDEKIISYLKEDRLDKLLKMDMNFIEDAKPDSLWQMLILYGALQVVPMAGEVLSYQVPTYFGMLVASFQK